MLLTVIICTYDRNVLLTACLRSLLAQRNAEHFSILVVDNFGDPKCKTIALKYQAEYVQEVQAGLSHARNRGWKTVTTDWVLYLDDDALAYPNLIAQTIHRIQEFAPSLLGGRFEHYFREPPPSWLRWYYREGYRPSSQQHFGPLPAGSYLVGGILVVYVPDLKIIGGFDTTLGMQGQSIGWAEEDELQDRFRAAGRSIYYDPAMVIDHLVQPYKYSMKKRLLMAYCSGRDALPRYQSPWKKIGYFATTLLKALVIKVPFRLVRTIRKPGYYWQNGLLDTGTDVAFACGQLNNQRRRYEKQNSTTSMQVKP